MNDTNARGQGGPAEILLVENSARDVTLTRRAFQDAKIFNRLTVVGDGEEALNRLRSMSGHADGALPDLVFIDLNLPRLGGAELLRAMKDDPRLRTIPVIVLTGGPAEIDILSSYTIAADGYATKPLDFQQLAAIVAKVETLGFNIVVRN